MLFLDLLPAPRTMLLIFSFNNTPTTEMYTLSLQDAFPSYKVPSAKTLIVELVNVPLIPGSVSVLFAPTYKFKLLVVARLSALNCPWLTAYRLTTLLGPVTMLVSAGRLIWPPATL